MIFSFCVYTSIINHETAWQTIQYIPTIVSMIHCTPKFDQGPSKILDIMIKSGKK